MAFFNTRRLSVIPIRPEPERRKARAALESLTGQVWLNRDLFLRSLRGALSSQGTALAAPVLKALWQAIGERDDAAQVCTDAKGNPEPDPELRDTEQVPLRDTIDDYLAREVLPHLPGASIDHTKTKVGYEIPFTRLFYTYTPPRPLAEIDAELDQLAKEIIELLQAVEG